MALWYFRGSAFCLLLAQPLERENEMLIKVPSLWQARSKADVETAQVRAAAAEDAQRLATEAAYVAYEDEATAEKAAREAQAIKEHAEDAVLRAWRQVCEQRINAPCCAHDDPVSLW